MFHFSLWFVSASCFENSLVMEACRWLFTVQQSLSHFPSFVQGGSKVCHHLDSTLPHVLVVLISDLCRITKECNGQLYEAIGLDVLKVFHLEEQMKTIPHLSTARNFFKGLYQGGWEGSIFCSCLILTVSFFSVLEEGKGRKVEKELYVCHYLSFMVTGLAVR